MEKEPQEAARLLSEKDTIHNKVDKYLEKDETRMQKSLWNDTSLRQKLTLLFAAAGNLFIYFCQSSPEPFLARVVLDRGGEGIYAAAIMHSSYLFSSIASLVCGKYQSTIPTKSFLWIGLLLVGVSQGCLGFLDYINNVDYFLAVGIFVKAFQGVGQGFFNVATLTLLWQEAPDHVGKLFGMSKSAESVGAVLGPLLGCYLYSIELNMVIPFVVSAAPPLVLSFVGWLVLPQTSNVVEASTKTKWRYIFDAKSILVIGLSATCSGLTAIFDASFTAYAQSLGLTVILVGVIMSVSDASAAVANIFVGYFSDVNHICRKFSIILCFLTVLGIDFAFTQDQTILFLFIEAIVFGMFAKAIQTFGLAEVVHQAASEDKNLLNDFAFSSELSGIWYFVVNLATFVIGVFGTGLQSVFTYSDSLSISSLVGTSLTLVVALAIYIFRYRNR